MPPRIQIAKIPGAVASHILEQISEGTLEPGDRLPPQRQLARQLGIGLSSLREALHALEMVGIVEVKRGKGTFITRYSTPATAKGLRWALVGPSGKLGELLEVRGMFETEVAALAAERATEENIHELDRLLSNIREAVSQGDRPLFEELDVRFHVAIAEATQNKMAARLVSILYALVADVFHEIPYTEEQLESHREVASAIARGDPEAARRAVRALVQAVSRAVQVECDVSPES